MVVSHLHADHFLDLIGLRYGIKYGELGGNRPLRVLLPPGGCDRLRRLGAALDDNPGFFEEVFGLEEYDGFTPIGVNDLTIIPRQGPALHPIPCAQNRGREHVGLLGRLGAVHSTDRACQGSRRNALRGRYPAPGPGRG